MVQTADDNMKVISQAHLINFSIIYFQTRIIFQLKNYQ